MARLKPVFFAVFLIIAAGTVFSTTYSVNVNGCANVPNPIAAGASDTLVINFTQNIVATNSSNITSDACVYYSPGAEHIEMRLNGFNITNSGSSATRGIFINPIIARTVSSTFEFDITGNPDSGGIHGFDTAVFVNLNANYSIKTSSGPYNLNITDASYGIFCNVTEADAGGCMGTTSPGANVLVISYCNVSRPWHLNFSNASIGTRATGITTVQTCQHNPPGELYSISSTPGGALIMSSTGNVYISLNLFNTTILSPPTTINNNSQQSVANVSLSYSETSFTAGTSKYAYISALPTSNYYANVISLPSWNISSMTGRVLYSTTTTFSNPLYFRGITPPFMLTVPTEPTCNVVIGSPYDYIKFVATSGASPYEAASAVNSEYPQVYLVIGASYQVTREYGGITTVQTVSVQNYGGSCYFTPSISSGSNVSYGVIPVGTCWQRTLNITSCSYLYSGNTSVTWSVKGIDTNNSAILCWNNSTSNVGVLDCDIGPGKNAVVSLYFNSSYTKAVSASFHNGRSVSTNMMWIFIYAGVSITIAFVSTRVPIIMAGTELLVTFMFYIAGLIDITILGMGFTIWSLMFVGAVIPFFKKEMRSG